MIGIGFIVVSVVWLVLTLIILLTVSNYNPKSSSEVGFNWDKLVSLLIEEVNKLSTIFVSFSNDIIHQTDATLALSEQVELEKKLTKATDDLIKLLYKHKPDLKDPYFYYDLNIRKSFIHLFVTITDLLNKIGSSNLPKTSPTFLSSLEEQLSKSSQYLNTFYFRYHLDISKIEHLNNLLKVNDKIAMRDLTTQLHFTDTIETEEFILGFTDIYDFTFQDGYLHINREDDKLLDTFKRETLIRAFQNSTSVSLKELTTLLDFENELETELFLLELVEEYAFFIKDGYVFIDISSKESKEVQETIDQLLTLYNQWEKGGKRKKINN